jgi:hypothetical protein
MRLLRIQRDEAGQDEPLQIIPCEFVGDRSNIPRYAILSHRWREEEVLFADMEGEASVARAKNGYQKLEASCEIALGCGFKYIWCDTCCIDKSSSAELSEAINSMYEYYSKSGLCIVYLDDIEDDPQDDSYLERAIWFSRGWTLQELVAPEFIVFYSQKWQKLGWKEDLKRQISIVSGIDQDVLDYPLRVNEISVSEKMSWASQRTTTRPEDLAYSLMGIFGVHMPPLYIMPIIRQLVRH